jgi:hypothetical protein
MQRQTFNNSWRDVSDAAQAGSSSAWYASDWDLRKYVNVGGVKVPQLCGQCETTTVRLDVVAPADSGANTSLLGTHNSVEVQIENCIEPAVPNCISTATVSTVAYGVNGQRSVLPVLSFVGTLVSSVRLTHSTFTPPGEPKLRFRDSLGTWQFIASRQSPEEWTPVATNAIPLRDYDLQLVQDPDPWLPESATEAPTFKFVPIPYPAGSWEVTQLSASGTLAFRDEPTSQVVAQIPLSETTGTVPAEGLAFLSDWSFTGTPVVAAAGQSDAVAQPLSGEQRLPDGEYEPDFHGVVAFDPEVAAAPFRGTGSAGIGYVDAPYYVNQLRLGSRQGEGGAASDQTNGPFSAFDYRLGRVVNAGQTLWFGSSPDMWLNAVATSDNYPAIMRCSSPVFVGVDLYTDNPVMIRGGGAASVPSMPVKVELVRGTVVTPTGEQVLSFEPRFREIPISYWPEDESSRLVFKLASPGGLPPTVERLPVKFVWRLRAALNHEERQTLKQAGFVGRNLVTPPEPGRSHMIYTVLDRPIVFDAEPPEAGHPWYNALRFDRMSAQEAQRASVSADVSPLDMATVLGEGASDASQAVQRVVNGFYEHSMYRYVGSVTNSIAQSDVGRSYVKTLFRLRKCIRTNKVQCSDVAEFMKVLSGAVGVRTDVVYIGPQDDEHRLWTRYVAPIGNQVLSAYFAPNTSYNPRRKKPQTDMDGISQGFDIHAFTQAPFLNHFVLSFNGLVYDGSIRFQSTEQIDDVNRHGYINQCNLEVYALKLFFFAGRRAGLRMSELTAVVEAAHADYAEFFGVTGARHTGKLMQDYLNGLLYLSLRPDLQKITGFDPGAVITLPDDLTIKD